ncbi:unnamed protein product [Brachionus calyciflorus]|uniref:Uncharacterized protein n=1 Tax=Brachionus calyciflorus TaxID=104777 RepID=A0A813PFD4_9BILA|nr:unnamed protein product [Brachionus calyciflorus]
MKIQKLSSLKLGDSLKKLQFKFVKFIVQYPFVVIVICALISIALSICGLYMSPLTSLSLPTKELSTIGTPLSTRRNIKEKLDRLLQNKELYKIDDLVKKFNQTQSDLLLGLEKTGRSLTNYALVSSKDDNKGDYSDESEFSDDMIQRIAKEIGSSFVENQKFKRDIDSVEDVDENGNVDGADGDDGEEKEELNEKKIELVSDDDSNLFAKKSTFISCNSVLNGKFNLLRLFISG